MPRGLVVVALAALCSTALVVGQGAPVVDRESLLGDLDRLASDEMAGRAMGTAGSARARALIVERFAEAGLQPFGDGFEMPFVVRGRRGVNVVGRVAGTDRPGRVIVVSAHYDHLGIRDGVVFNGANDNASGTAALIAVARHFVAAVPRHTLIRAAFDGEELGLLGSRAFVRDPPVPADTILLDLNADMLARDPSRVLYVAGTQRFPALRSLVAQVAGDAPVTVRLGHDDPDAPGEEDWTPDSDQFAFIQAGIPALYVGVEDYAQHHRATDDFETVDTAFYLGAVRTLIRMVEVFDAHAAELEAVREDQLAGTGTR